MNEERIDIVIPVYKPDETFFRCIGRLLTQTVRPGTIFLMLTLADEECPDEAETLRKQLARLQERLPGSESVMISVTPLAKSDFNHGNTRNDGMRKSRAEYTVCMTMDAVPWDNRLLEHLRNAMQMQPNAVAVYARQTGDDKADILTHLTQGFNYPKERIVKDRSCYETMGIKAIFCSDVCCMYRREAWDALGGFEENILFGEDTLFAKKALDYGHEVVYEPEARVIHWHRYSLRQLLCRNFDIGVNQKDHPEVFGELSSESEGIRYVKKVIRCLAKRKKFGKIFVFVAQSGAKWIGYRLGKSYKVLPNRLAAALISNPQYLADKKNDAKKA